MGSFPCCASWMSCSSSCSVNSGLTIFRFVSLCLASGDNVLLRSACFCASSSCCICACLCSSDTCLCSAESFLLRSSSSSSSDTSVTLLVFLQFRKLFHQFPTDFLSHLLQKSSTFACDSSSMGLRLLD